MHIYNSLPDKREKKKSQGDEGQPLEGRQSSWQGSTGNWPQQETREPGKGKRKLAHALRQKPTNKQKSYSYSMEPSRQIKRKKKSCLDRNAF